MYSIDKKVFLYSFSMLVCSILFITFWVLSAQLIIKTNWFTASSSNYFNEIAYGIIILFCGSFFTFVYIIYEILTLRFIVKNKKEIKIKKYKLYFYLLIVNFFFTILTSLILFVFSGKYYFKHLLKESEVINKKIEELKNKKKEKKV